MKKGIIILVLVALVLAAIFYIDKKENTSDETETTPESAAVFSDDLPMLPLTRLDGSGLMAKLFTRESSAGAIFYW